MDERKESHLRVRANRCRLNTIHKLLKEKKVI